MSAPPKLPPLPSPSKGKGKKHQTPAQRAAAAAAYQKAKGQNPYFQGQAFLEKKQELSTIWEAYSGKQITNAQARRIIALGWSNYHLQVYLSSQKSFVGSPVWKTNAPGYLGIYKQMFGASAKAKQKLISYAIVHNLGSSFADYLRQQPGYVKSVEYKNNYSSLENIYRSVIGGVPDVGTIKKATLAGWNQDQFVKYLRNSDQYVYSDEAKNTFTALASAFGGTVNTLNFGQPDQQPPPNQNQGQQQNQQQQQQQQGGGGNG
jgi:hypothetical protein